VKGADRNLHRFVAVLSDRLPVAVLTVLDEKLSASDEVAEHSIACSPADTEESGRLPQIQAQPRHVVILTNDPRDDFSPRGSAIRCPTAHTSAIAGRPIF
jgi:hypothetical protein